MAEAAARRMRVLESVGSIKKTTNPYLAMLVESLRRRPDVELELFDFRRAILGRYDVFHVHWPEVTFGGHRAVGRLVRRSLTSVLLLRLALTRTPIVRTWHNTERPSGLSRWDHRLLDGFDALTRVRIRLNDVTELPADAPVVTVPLGHYRDWFAAQERRPAVTGRLAYVGLIRRYKGVESLVSAFRDVADPSATLQVVGKTSTAELAATIRDLAGDDERISLEFGFVEDPEFVAAVTESSLVVLPFRHMHNSSTVIAALSLERPVLVPDNDVNRSLAAEIGAEWIHTFEGELDADDIERTLRALSTSPPRSAPDLDSRGWDDAARLHAEAFRLAIESRRARRSGRSRRK